VIPDVYEPVEKSTGREHHRLRRKSPTINKFDADEAIAIGQQFDNLGLLQEEVRHVLEQTTHLGPVDSPIRLRARRLNGGTTATVEQAELNASPIGDETHHSTERIDLAHEMSFRDSSDRRIAGHLPDQIEIDGDERRPGASPSSRMRRFAAGMSPADDYDVENLVELDPFHHLLNKKAANR
jgi:hypothetical protein